MRNCGRAHEASVLVELRTGFHATAAGDTTREWIGLLLLFRAHARTRTQVVGAINRDPRFNRFQIFKQNAAIDGQIANHGEFGKWLEPDRLVEFIYQRRARHARASVDEHGAGAANFLETVGVVGDGRGRLAIAGDRVRRNIH